MVSPSQSSYYDIDAILAEEELIPVTNLLDFSHLAHLDPDYVHHRPISSKGSYKRSKATTSAALSSSITVSSTPMSLSQSSMTSSSSSSTKNKTNRKRRNNSTYTNHHHHLLPEHTKFKMPLWSIHKWSELNFIQISLPKHYNRKGREKLETDPVSLDLRSKCERYYMSGMALIDLISHTVKTFDKMNRRKSTAATNNNPQKQLMRRLYNESQLLKNTILQTYTGARLRQTLNWTMSSNTEDDVSGYTKKLTEMERRLFQCSADASYAFMMWKLYGSHRIVVSETAVRAKVMSLNRNIQNQNDSSHHDGDDVEKKNGKTTPTPTYGKRSSARLISPENDVHSRGGGNGNGNQFNNCGSRKRMRSY